MHYPFSIFSVIPTLFCISTLYGDPAIERAANPEFQSAQGAATADFSFDTACSSMPTQFYNLSTGAVSYRWQFGDGNISLDSSPIHSYDSGGTYSVTLTAFSAEGDSNAVTLQVPVRQAPVFLDKPDTLQCFGRPTTFKVSTIHARTFVWDFGDGDVRTGDKPVHQYVKPGKYLLKVTAFNQEGCKTVMQQPFVVSVPISFSFSVSTVGRTSVFTIDPPFKGLVTWRPPVGREVSDTARTFVYTHPAINHSPYYISAFAIDSFGCRHSFQLRIEQDTISNIAPEDGMLKLTLSPNPFTSQASVSWQGAQASGAVLMDAQGRVVRQLSPTRSGDANRVSIDGEDLASGPYFVVINSAGGKLGKVLLLKE